MFEFKVVIFIQWYDHMASVLSSPLCFYKIVCIYSLLGCKRVAALPAQLSETFMDWSRDDCHVPKLGCSNILRLKGEWYIWATQFFHVPGTMLSARRIYNCVSAVDCVCKCAHGGVRGERRGVEWGSPGGFLWMEQWKVKAPSCGHSVCLLFILFCLT